MTLPNKKPCRKTGIGLFFALVAALWVTAGCKVDFPHRKFDDMKNEVVLYEVNQLLQTDGFSGNSYRFNPVFSNTELSVINAVNFRLLNSLGEVCAETTLLKPNAQDKPAEQAAKGADSAAAPKKEGETTADTGWGKQKFAWIPKKPNGELFTFPPDEYKYIITVYDRYQKNAKGKITYKEAQKRIFVYKFSCLLAPQTQIVSVSRLKPEQDTGYSNTDGITQTKTGLVARGLLNLKEDFLAEIGATAEQVEAEHVFFQLKKDGEITSSDPISVTAVSADVAEFGDVGITAETEGIENFKFFKWTIPDTKTAADGSYSLTLVLSYTVNGMEVQKSSEMYSFLIDTTPPVAYWKKVWDPDHNKSVRNTEKKTVADTDIQQYPTFRWNFDADEDGIRQMRDWFSLAFTDGSQPVGISHTPPAEHPMYKGSNFTVIDSPTAPGSLVNTVLSGVQEIQLEVYDLAGNRALAKEGGTATEIPEGSSVEKSAICRRAKIAEPDKSIGPFANAGFENSQGMNNYKDHDGGKGKAPGWNAAAWASITWTGGDNKSCKLHNYGDAGWADNEGTGPFTNNASNWDKYRGVGVFCESGKAKSGANYFYFVDSYTNDYIPAGSQNRYHSHWGRCTQRGFQALKNVTYTFTGWVLNGKHKNPDPPAALLVKAVKSIPLTVSAGSVSSEEWFNGYFVVPFGNNNAETWQQMTVDFTAEEACEVELGFAKLPRGHTDDGDVTRFDDASVAYKSHPKVDESTLVPAVAAP